ncbi:MAG: hypothetical protein GY802_25625 [Gammaproteobacteria bacterium]|nr:hypothetical protein [Gammaproteobacteria bacterium]
MLGYPGSPWREAVDFDLLLEQMTGDLPAGQLLGWSLSGLEQPVKLILGERDLLVPTGIRQQITDVAPGIQVESFAGAAHAPFLSHPTQVAALL